MIHNRPTLSAALDALETWLTRLMIPFDGEWRAYLHHPSARLPWVTLHTLSTSSPWILTTHDTPFSPLSFQLTQTLSGWTWQSGNTICLTITGSDIQPIITENPQSPIYVRRVWEILQQQALALSPQLSAHPVDRMSSHPIPRYLRSLLHRKSLPVALGLATVSVLGSLAFHQFSPHIADLWLSLTANTLFLLSTLSLIAVMLTDFFTAAYSHPKTQSVAPYAILGIITALIIAH